MTDTHKRIDSGERENRNEADAGSIPVAEVNPYRVQAYFQMGPLESGATYIVCAIETWKGTAESALALWDQNPHTRANAKKAARRACEARLAALGERIGDSENPPEQG